MNLSSRLSELMAERGFSATSLGKKAEVSQTIISAILRDEGNPSIATLEAICSGLGISLVYLFSGENEGSLSDDEKRLLKLYRSTTPLGRSYSLASVEAFYNQYRVFQKSESKKPFISIKLANSDASCDNTVMLNLPVMGRSAAGTPIEMVSIPEEPVTINGEPRVRAGDFIVIAVGDSMIEAGIHDGDQCVIRPQDQVENGEIALIAVDDGSTIKRFYQDDQGIHLKPCNPAHPTQHYDVDAPIRVLGRFITVVK